MTHSTVLVNGSPVHYLVAGSGEAVVLIHGLSGSTLWWRPTLPALLPGYRVFLVDLPGFGRMRRMARQFALSNAAHWLADWMQAVGLREANVVGHSMGGYIALQLAAIAPHAVSRLILVTPAGMPKSRTILGYTLPLIRALPHMAPRFFPVLVADALRAGPLTVLRAARDLTAQDVRAAASEVRAPTLIVCGRHDTLVPPSAGTVLRQLLPNARYLLIDGAGHVPMYERPSAFNEALLAFLGDQPVGE
ncbi:MAG TPA: alpha/beta hydrolase [Chloroflexota bacterium]|nr:alpha/beta hydrolase [Chloroflexota bacterium]